MSTSELNTFRDNFVEASGRGVRVLMPVGLLSILACLLLRKYAICFENMIFPFEISLVRKYEYFIEIYDGFV